MVEPKHVDGKPCGKIFIYALSTCGWCRKTKNFLNEQGVAYDYIDVDMLEGDEKDRVMNEVEKWNPSRSFPTVVIDDKDCIVGFQEQRLTEVIKREPN